MSTIMNVSDKYKMYENQREHLLNKPGMYIGSIQADDINMWVLSKTDPTRMEYRKCHIVPGLLIIVRELVSNAMDHAKKLSMQKGSGTVQDACQVTEIRVSVDRETGAISVYNNGDGIEIQKHEKYGIYIPELIFGNMLTSSNYDDTQDRVVQGTNGIGCKACNILSKSFEVETVDHREGKRYKQLFVDNMTVVKPPKITNATKAKPFTRVTFVPDYARFSCPDGLTDDIVECIRKMTYDVCAIVPAKVYFNDALLPCAGFKKYVAMYVPDGVTAHEIVDDMWEVAASCSDSFQQVSFVNGLPTTEGGTHVRHFTDKLTSDLIAMFKSKNKVDVKPQTIKNNLFVFVKCNMKNPAFNSQTKESLTNPVSTFGSGAASSIKIGPAFVKKIYAQISPKCMALTALNDDKVLKKTDGKKVTQIKGIPKLDDAPKAGGPQSHLCTLILTEGDSAAAMALAGLSVVDRQLYGVFPLKGKVMNVRDTALKRVAENDEICNLKKIVGLESGKAYDCVEDVRKLRYGKLMLMTDADYDGSHIKGLIFNLLKSLWPNLAQRESEFMITSMLTPIIKTSKNKEEIKFYNQTDYEKWAAAMTKAELGKWKTKYYKGLGTSTNAEAKDYFRDMRCVVYDLTDDAPLALAFDKTKADERKLWLGTYDRKNVIDYEQKEVDSKEFVDGEFIHFSNYDLERSIPGIDGLKPGQRKIMYALFKKNLKEEKRVAQLAGYVSETAAYHHGEVSLQSTMIGMAQNFVGSNNINVLMPNGQFGSRVYGGKDAGQPRYIHTLLNNIVHTIFPKDDLPVLDYRVDDGETVEPYFYTPIIPMSLVNGAMGIGTGYSTTIPCYNPATLIRYILNKLTGGKALPPPLHPWYRGFKGVIEELPGLSGQNGQSGKYRSKGVWKRASPTTVQITELPIGTWTFDYKEDLEKLLDTQPEFRKYVNLSSEEIDITLHFANKSALDIVLSDTTAFEKIYKLVSVKGLSTTNMYLFNAKGQIQKYDRVEDIIDDFYTLRLETYHKRKAYMDAQLHREKVIAKNKVRFVKEVIDGSINVYKITKPALEETLIEREYNTSGETFDYLTRMPIYNFTTDHVMSLEEQLAKIKAELIALRNTTPQQMWERELVALEKML